MIALFMTTRNADLGSGGGGGGDNSVEETPPDCYNSTLNYEPDCQGVGYQRRRVRGLGVFENSTMRGEERPQPQLLPQSPSLLGMR